MTIKLDHARLLGFGSGATVRIVFRPVLAMVGVKTPPPPPPPPPIVP